LLSTGSCRAIELVHPRYGDQDDHSILRGDHQMLLM
jgi:hypothetical protein